MASMVGASRARVNRSINDLAALSITLFAVGVGLVPVERRLHRALGQRPQSDQVTAFAVAAALLVLSGPQLVCLLPIIVRETVSARPPRMGVHRGGGPGCPDRLGK